MLAGREIDGIEVDGEGEALPEDPDNPPTLCDVMCFAERIVPGFSIEVCSKSPRILSLGSWGGSRWVQGRTGGLWTVGFEGGRFFVVEWGSGGR